MCGWGQVGNEHVSGKGHIQVSRSMSKVKIRQQISAFLSLYLIYIWFTEWASGVWLPARRLPYLDKGSGEASLLPLGPTWPFWIDAVRSESCSKLCLLFDTTRDTYTEKVCKALYGLVTPPPPYETLHSNHVGIPIPSSLLKWGTKPGKSLGEMSKRPDLDDAQVWRT